MSGQNKPYTFKRCPFCGHLRTLSVITIEDWFKNDKYKVVCGEDKFGCGASTAWYYSEEEAIEAWNRRFE